jgi:hypothetical protein
MTAITTVPGTSTDPPEYFDPGDVIAITLLDDPNYANTRDLKSDANTAFIAHARDDVKLLVEEIRRLRKLI